MSMTAPGAGFACRFAPMSPLSGGQSPFILREWPETTNETDSNAYSTACTALGKNRRGGGDGPRASDAAYGGTWQTRTVDRERGAGCQERGDVEAALSLPCLLLWHASKVILHHRPGRVQKRVAREEQSRLSL